tara:strand:- start:69 stop:839 length:771 start_codon:yes stop_codon:yes gene_type:complete
MIQDNPLHYSIGTRVRNGHLIDLLDPGPDDRVLDVGCGTGYFADLFSNKGAEVWGVDADPYSVNVARIMLKDRVKVSGAESLPSEDNFFDKVLCSEVLEHIYDDNSAIREICRVVKPGGSVVIAVPSYEGVFGAKIKSICHEHECGLESHARDGYSRTELVTLLEKNGLKVETSLYTMVFFVEMIMGLLKLGYSWKSSSKHLHSQADLIHVKDSWWVKAFALILPMLLLVGKMEDVLLAPLLKGHMLIVKCTATDG